MLLKTLLLKIETGQPLSEKQEKSLATKLGLNKSISKTTFRTLFFFLLVISSIVVSFSIEMMEIKIVLYIIIIVLFLLEVFLILFPKTRKLNKYFEAVDVFYKTAFKDFENFDLYYLGQHKNPHVKVLRSKKIYLLTDGYYFVFIEDYFKDTKYKMPFFYSRGESINLRVIDEKSLNNDIMVIKLEDIESFNLIGQELILNNKISKNFKEYFDYFFDQNKYMTEKDLTLLTMKNGLVMRLSYTAYSAFKKHMPYKEKQ